MTKYAKIQELEKTIRTLQSKVDQLISKDAEKKRKEALDKLITKGGGNKVVAKNDKGQQSPQVSP
jgi:response regulator of citrate/malate metabolism